MQHGILQDCKQSRSQIPQPNRRAAYLHRCARPIGVPRGPATSTGSLASQRHPGKLTNLDC